MNRMITSPTRRVAGLLSLAVVAAAFAPKSASAYELKHTKTGAEMRWTAASVDFAVSPTLRDIPNATDAVPSIFASWADASARVPVLRAERGVAHDEPGYDGKNILFYAEHGFAPAGDALAVTVLTADTHTGAILDADIVLNGRYSLAVLCAQNGDASGSKTTYDVVHVLAHETGHALGLDHEAHDTAALMYPTTRANDVSVRTPSADDLAGIAKLYVASTTASTTSETVATDTGSSSASHHGCGGATIATRGAGGFHGSAVAVGAAALIAIFVASRRRSARRLGTALSVTAFSMLAFHASPATAHSGASPASHARARVVQVQPRWIGGLMQTELTMRVSSSECAEERCADIVRTTVWGGVDGSITQQIGEQRAPQLDDVVDLSFDDVPVVGHVRITSLAIVPTE